MDNIFKNAYFGKLYKTRDGRKAIYLSKGKISIFSTIHRLAIEPTKFSNVESIGKYDDAGNCSNGFYDCDIVSEWQEEINEE